MIGLQHYLVVSAMLFVLSIAGIVVNLSRGATPAATA